MKNTTVLAGGDRDHWYGNQTLVLNSELCTLETCDLSLSSFTYRPSVAGNAIFAALLGLFLLGQLFLGVKHKTWGYMVAMVLGLFLEVIGYVGRILIYNNPFDNNFFLMSLVTLTIAPALLTAAIYLCLARIVHVYGSHLSYFKPRTYTLLFCTCDLISLVLQAVGGAIASMAETTKDNDLGRNIMLGGLGFQVFSLGLFALCAGDFARRVFRHKNDWNINYVDLVHTTLFKAFLGGLVVATVTIFIRSLYRCIELSAGFDSHLFKSDEVAFMILEGVMIVLACGCLTLLHPAVCFQGAWSDANFSFRTPKSGSEKLMSSRDSADGLADIELGNVQVNQNARSYAN